MFKVLILALSVCRSMNSKLVSQEEQITEYNERIAATEDELKKAKFFFSLYTSAFVCVYTLLSNFLFVMSQSCKMLIILFALADYGVVHRQ